MADDARKRAESAEEREAADPLVRLELRLQRGKTVTVDEVREAWGQTRYPRAMIRVLAERRRPELAVRAAACVGIDVDLASETWREDLEAHLFERFFGAPFEETDRLATDIRRAIPDPSR